MEYEVVAGLSARKAAEAGRIGDGEGADLIVMLMPIKPCLEVA